MKPELLDTPDAQPRPKPWLPARPWRSRSEAYGELLRKAEHQAKRFDIGRALPVRTTWALRWRWAHLRRWRLPWCGHGDGYRGARYFHWWAVGPIEVRRYDS